MAVIAPDRAGAPGEQQADRFRLSPADLQEIEDRFHWRHQLFKRLREKYAVPEKKGNWSDNARTVIARRISLKGPNGEALETPEEMCWRVALGVATAEADFAPAGTSDEAVEKRVLEVAHLFYDMLVEQRGCPNSPTLTNAGKPDLLSLAACFVLPVEDSLDKIFDTVKHTALIHKAGGGCVDGRSLVFTTFCGVEEIHTVWNRISALGRQAVETGNGRAIDISDLGVRTLSQNPETGEFEQDDVTHVWSFDVPREQQRTVRTSRGAVTTSEWHPFMALRGGRLVEVRADQLRPGDILLRTNRSVRAQWPVSAYKTVAGRDVTEDLGWLLGYFQGDGSLGTAKIGNPKTKRFGDRKLRLRFFDGRKDNLERAAAILRDHFGTQVNVHQDARGLYSVTTTASEVTNWVAAALDVRPGEKTDLRIPDYIFKSPLSVVRHYIAGLVDSDGTVDSRGRVSVTMSQPSLMKSLHALADLLGFEPAIRERAPRGKGRTPVTEVKLSSVDKASELRGFLLEALTDPVKRGRLAAAPVARDDSARVSSYERIPLPFPEVEPLLAEAGVETRSTAIHRRPVMIGGDRFWLHNFKEGKGIGRHALRRLVAALRRVLGERPSLDLLAAVAENATVVEAVSVPKEKVALFDFSVARNNTYLASGGEFIAIHNTGFNFSYLRPNGARVGSTGGVSSGPVSFMQVIGAATESVKQGGTRRGANMGMLRIDHPDILEFIDCKRHGNRTTASTNFNISVLVHDAFMDKLSRNEDYELIHPQTGSNLDPEGRPVGKLNSREVWNRLVQGAWETGDPGVVFVDRLERDNPTPNIGKLECTNPCGEQPLLPYEACNLGSLNISKHVAVVGGKKTVDWVRLAADSKLMTRMLDDVIQSSWYAMPEIFEMVRGNRKIGVGIMGYGDLLIDLEIAYDSEEALQLAEKIMKTIHEATVEATRELAVERGAFPNFKGSVYDRRGEPIRRNALTTTIAPTGTIGLVCDAVCAGCEPLFAVAYMRTTADGIKLPYVHPRFEQIARQEGWYSDELMEEIARVGHVRGNPRVPEHWQNIFVTAHDVTPEWHLRTQAAFQKWTDNAVSKTVNFPNDATPADVDRVYMLAWETNCKGVTIFRDGSLDHQVLTVGTKDQAKQAAAASAPGVPLPSSMTRKIEVPDERRGFTKTITTGLGKMHITINEMADGLPIELFTTIGKAGSDIMADAEAIGRLVSLALQLGAHPSLITHTLRGIGGSNAVGFGPNRVTSIADAIAKVLEDRYLAEHERGGFELGMCPDCGKGAVVQEVGCATCKECGWKGC